MPDHLSAADRKRTMQAVKSKNTGPERKLRAMLSGAGLRGWKLHPKNVIGTPDIAFLDQKIVIFLDGCFWHGCPICKRPLPQTNVEYWQRKIQRNVSRDVMQTLELEQTGWHVFRFWEHQMKDKQARRAFVQAIKNVLMPTK